MTLMREAILSLMASGGVAISYSSRPSGSGCDRPSRRARNGRRGAAVDGVEQDLLDVVDDRCIVDFDLRRLGLRLGLGRHEIARHLLVCKSLSAAPLRSPAVDERAEFGILDHDGFDVQPGLKLDLVIAARLVGSDMPTKSRFPRKKRQRPPAFKALASMNFAGRWSVSKPARSISGKPKVWAAKSATSASLNFLPAISCSTNVTGASLALTCSCSASRSASSPFWTIARPRPDS